MSRSAAEAVAFTPLHLALTPELSISGLWLRGEGRLTVLFLHDFGADLGAVLPVLANLGVPEAHKIAVDLPGHGMSDGTAEDAAPALDLLCDALGAEGHGPFVIVGCGHSADLAWTLGGRKDVFGLSLVSPVLGKAGAATREPFQRGPVLVFLATASPEVVTSWSALKMRLRARWLSVSLAVRHEDLVAFRNCDRQISSHIGGFVRDLMAM